MPIKEESFRIGSGRYIQGEGYVERVGEEVRRLGNFPLVVGGKTALCATGDGLVSGISQNCDKYEIITHTSTCNDEDAEKLAQLMNEKGYDVVVGVGGGVICDFAKLIGFFSQKPVVNVPTSSATCAAYTPLSVRYTQDGRTVGSKHYPYEVDCVVVDSAIIAKQPPRLLLAGVFDALAKFVEIKQRFREDSDDFPMGLDYAYYMSKYSHTLLKNKTKKCLDDMEKGNITDDVEKLIFTTIGATGVISGIARGSNQTALAHKFYETARFFYPAETRPYLHGEIVGVGLLLQNHYNGEVENNELILELMQKYNMPFRLKDINVPADDKSFEEFFLKICDSSAVNKEDAEEVERFRISLQYLWNLK